MPLIAFRSQLVLSSGALCAYSIYMVNHMHFIKSSKYLQAFKDVPRSHSVTLSNEAELVLMFEI